MTAPRKRTPKKMSLDRGFVPTKRQREIEKAFFKRGGRHPAYIGFIAADSGLRESWEHRRFTKQRMARRLHVSPRGTYFSLAGLDPLVGSYLQAAGLVQNFRTANDIPRTARYFAQVIRGQDTEFPLDVVAEGLADAGSYSLVMVINGYRRDICPAE